MKRYRRLLPLTLVLGLSSMLLVFAQAQAQINAFTYFIPFPTDLLDDQFNVGQSDTDLTGVDIETIISIALHQDGMFIYYDHWEDGLEADLTLPQQASTEIWGDNNPSNGVAPGFGSDILPAGYITLRNTVLVPRDSSEFFFDGGIS